MIDINKELSDTSSALYVISSLMRKPDLLEGNYALLPDDFCSPLQKIAFTSIYNMEKNGATQLTPQDLDLYIKTQPNVYEYYSQNKGYEWLQTAYTLTENSDSNQFDYYYERLKKFTILRELVKQGIDIKDFYDLSTDLLDRDEQDNKLDTISAAEIINSVREKLVSIEDKNVGKTVMRAETAAEGLRELVKGLEEHPDVGLPLDGAYLNAACRGARLGKFYIYSAATGAGKTRHMLGNACALSLPYVQNHRIVARDGFEKILFITTEQEPDEIKTMVLANVSGVNEEKILTHTFNASEAQDLELGIQILEKYGNNFIIEPMPDPSIAAVGTRITKHILQDKVRYIFYDYIFSSTGLLSEFRDLKIREDVALRLLSTKLKEIATTYNVYIESGTQLNSNWESMTVRNQNTIEGSKAIANKIDFGMIGVRLIPGSEEAQSIQPYLDEHSFAHTPNLVIDIYKNRRGQATAVKLFRYFDYGTCRSEDLFVMDTDYKPYSIARDNDTVYKKVYNNIADLERAGDDNE